MAFKNIHNIDVAYDNKVYGNLIDPYEWNKNFTDIEQNITTNAENLNDNFAMLSGSDGAANITSPDVIGGTGEPSTVSAQLISIVSRLLDTYTITELDSKFEQVNANTVRTISFNADNGSFIITNNDGSTTVIDTNIEKIPVSVSLEKNGEEVMLVITNYDGTTSSADVTNLLNVYNFIDSNTLRFNVDKYDISAEVKKGSITFEHLADGVVSAIEKLRDEARAAKNDAEAAKTAAETAEANAEQSAKISESYAVGTSGIRNGETTDNAKYYSEQAGVAKNEAEAARDEAAEAKEAVSAFPRTYYGVCDSLSTESVKEVVVNESFKLVDDSVVFVKFNKANSENPPYLFLNINNTGDIPIEIAEPEWVAGTSLCFVYKNGKWNAQQYPKANNQSVGLVTLNDRIDSTSDRFSGAAATPYAVKQAYDKAVEAKTVADAAATPEYVDATVEQSAQGALQTVENNYLPLTGGMIKNPNGDSSLSITKSVKSTDPNDDIDSTIGVVGLSVGNHPLNEDTENPLNGAHLLLLESATFSGVVLSAIAGCSSISLTGYGYFELASDSANSRNYLTGLTEPIDDTDAANKKYVDDAVAGVSGGGSGCNCKHYYGECTTSPTTAEKIVTVSGNFVLEKGASIDVMFTYHNVASSPTMNVNGTGAVEIKAYGTTVPLAKQWRQGAVVRFVYNASNWVMVDGSVASTTYYGATKLNSSTSSTSEDTAATPLAVKQAYDKAVESDNKIDALETKINNIPRTYYGVCETAAAEMNKIVTVDDSFKLEVGATVNVRFNHNNTHSVPALNVNNTGAKSMVRASLIAVERDYWIAGGIVQFVYDGSLWVINNAHVELSDSVNLNDSTFGASSAAVKQAYDRGSTALTVASAAVPKSSLLRFTNVTFVANTGVTDTTYDGYAIRYDVSCTDVTTDYSADVRFAPADAVSGNFAPFCDTGNGIVKIYAKQAVKDNGGNITIPVIICTKMVD